MNVEYGGFLNDIIDSLSDKKIKTLFKENITTPLSSIILTEIYPYVYLSLMMVVISFLLIVSMFILLIRHFQMLNTINYLGGEQRLYTPT